MGVFFGMPRRPCTRIDEKELATSRALSNQLLGHPLSQKVEHHNTLKEGEPRATYADHTVWNETVRRATHVGNFVVYLVEDNAARQDAQARKLAGVSPTLSDFESLLGY